MSLLLQRLLGRVYREEESGAGDTGGGSAPAGGEEQSGSSQPVDWEAMNEGVSPGADDTDEGGDAQAAKPAKADPQQSASGTDDATTGEQTGEEDPEQKPEEEEAPPEEDAEPGEQLTPEQQAAKAAEFETQFKEWRASEVKRLAEKVYAFDADTAARLQTEPELVLPQLAAELEMNAAQRAMEAVQRLIPQLMRPVMQGQQLEDKANDFFFSKNPDLKKYKTQVLKAGRMFRELNPKATPEEAAKQIGEIVRTSLKLKPLAAGAAAPAAKPAAKPHKPAGAGSAPAPKPSGKTEQSVWDELSRDDD